MDKIEVYIRNEEVVTGRAIIGRPILDHWCTAKETLKTEKVLPEADRMTLEVVNEFAKANGLSAEVYDVSSFKGKLKARLREVKITPTVIMGNQKIEGERTAESLKNMLKSCLGEIQVKAKT